MKNNLVYLRHIEECLEKLIEYTENITIDDFWENSMIQDACVRKLEVIGEATKNLSIDIREHYSSFPWKGLAGMRDVMIHQYFRVDLQIVWDSAKYHAVDLLIQLQEIIEKERSVSQ